MRLALCAALAASGCLDFDGLGALYHGDAAGGPPAPDLFAADAVAPDAAANDLGGNLADLAAADLAGTFKRVFVTNSTYGAKMVASAATADLTCNQVGGALGGKFHAWVSDNKASPSGWLPPPVQASYVLVDGTPVAASHAAFFSDKHDHGITLTEKGLAPSSTMNPNGCPPAAVLVWTGTSPDGTVAPDTCSQWTDATAMGEAGDASALNSYWSSACAASCGAAAHLYCVEQ